MPITTDTADKTKFWVLCCDESEAAQTLFQSISDWQLPDVRCHLGYQLPVGISAMVAQSDYVLLVTAPASEQVSQPIRMSAPQPVAVGAVATRPNTKLSSLQTSLLHSVKSGAKPGAAAMAVSAQDGITIHSLSAALSINVSPDSPAALLAALHNRYGRTPQAWLAQVSAASLATPRDTEQTLKALKDFVRFYVSEPAMSAMGASRQKTRRSLPATPQWINCRRPHRI
ncbi:MAG: hypothetical protein AAFY33_20090 [Cyanobacteria bacterium J06643_4]